MKLFYCWEPVCFFFKNDGKCIFLFLQHSGASFLALPPHRPLLKVLYCERKCVCVCVIVCRLYFFIAFIFWFTFSTNSVQVLTLSLDFLMQWTESFHTLGFPPMNQHCNCYWSVCISVSSLGGSATIPWQLRTSNCQCRPIKNSLWAAQLKSTSWCLIVFFGWNYSFIQAQRESYSFFFFHQNCKNTVSVFRRKKKQRNYLIKCIWLLAKLCGVFVFLLWT